MVNADSVPLISGGIISLILFIFIFLKRKNLKSLIFSIFCLGLAIHGIAGFFTSYTTNPQLALFLNKLSFFGVILAVPSFVHFTIIYIHKAKKHFLINMWYLFSFVFALLTLGDFIFNGIKAIPGGFTGVAGPALIYFLIFTLLSYLFIFYKFIRYLDLEESVEEQNRVKYLLTLLSFLAIAAILDMLRKTNVFSLVNILLSEYAIIIFVIGTSYTIIKYHLLDIKIIFHRSTMYSMIGASVLIIFEVLKEFLNEILGLFLIHENTPATYLSVLCLTFLFEPIRDKTEKICDKIFLKK